MLTSLHDQTELSVGNITAKFDFTKAVALWRTVDLLLVKVAFGNAEQVNDTQRKAKTGLVLLEHKFGLGAGRNVIRDLVGGFYSDLRL